MSKKVLVIGLDGADPKFIEEMMNKNLLPNLKKLVNQGVSGILKSTIPASSPSAWTSFMTGVNIGKHGIFDFLLKDEKSYDFRLATSNDIKCDTIYELISKAGKRVILINVPMTYPPKKLNGIIISGIIAPMETLHKGFTYPKYLSSMLKKKGYVVEPRPLMFESLDKYYSEVMKVMYKRAKISLEFAQNEKFDFFMVNFIALDRLQHFLFADALKDDEVKNKLMHCYQELDKIIGEFLKIVDDRTLLVILSDHGFSPSDKKININALLYKEGYLKPQISKVQKLLSLIKYSIIKRENLYYLLGRVRLLPVLERCIPKSLKNKIKLESNISLDWNETKAYCVGKFIFLNLKGKELSNKNKLLSEIKNKLINFKYKDDNPIIQVFETKEIYRGPYYSRGGDLVVVFKEGYRHNSSLNVYNNKNIVQKEKIYKGTHHDSFDAFYVIIGPGTRKGTKASINITDIAPIILHHLGIEIPSHMDVNLNSLKKVLLEDIYYEIRFASSRNLKQRTKQSISRLKKEGNI